MLNHFAAVGDQREGCKVKYPLREVLFLVTCATTGLASVSAADKDHGRIETRTTTVTHDVGWLTSDRRHPGEHRFPGLTSLIASTTQVERHGKVTRDTRYFISSARLSPDRAAEASATIGASSACIGAGRNLQGGPVPPAPWPWCSEHGARPSPRLQHGPRRKRQKVHQDSPQSSRTENRRLE